MSARRALLLAVALVGGGCGMAGPMPEPSDRCDYYVSGSVAFTDNVHRATGCTHLIEVRP